MNRLPLYLCVLATASFHSYPSAAEVLPPSLRTCMSEQDDARRLSCFDRESARLAHGSAAATSQPQAAMPTAPAAVTPAATTAVTLAAAPAAEEGFGYRGSTAAEPTGPEQMTAKLTEVSTLPRGELVLTLDNGQVWIQKSADRPMRLKAGDEVTIKRASLGSYLLFSDAAKGSMRVTRSK
jgi:hypothetical protein